MFVSFREYNENEFRQQLVKEYIERPADFALKVGLTRGVRKQRLQYLNIKFRSWIGRNCFSIKDFLKTILKSSRFCQISSSVVSSKSKYCSSRTYTCLAICQRKLIQHLKKDK